MTHPTDDFFDRLWDGLDEEETDAAHEPVSVTQRLQSLPEPEAEKTPRKPHRWILSAGTAIAIIVILFLAFIYAFQHNKGPGLDPDIQLTETPTPPVEMRTPFPAAPPPQPCPLVLPASGVREVGDSKRGADRFLTDLERTIAVQAIDEAIQAINDLLDEGSLQR